MSCSLKVSSLWICIIFTLFFVTKIESKHKRLKHTLVDCSVCPESKVIQKFENNTCQCSENTLKKRQRNIDQCYRYRKGTFECPVSTDPKYAVFFDENSCECRIESAIPCGEYVAPCYPPYSWYKNDNVTYCLCTALFECSKCLPSTIIENFNNETCVCRDLTQDEYDLMYNHQTTRKPRISPSGDIDYCRLHKKNLFSCPEFENPLITSVFSPFRCSCEIIIADPCSMSVQPCLPPYYWFKGDDKITCACVNQIRCDQCESERILEIIDDETCVCIRPKSDDLLIVTTELSTESHKENCDLYNSGNYFCPEFESATIASYFNLSTCECESISAKPCWVEQPTCDQPYYWYNDDTRLLCLCVHQVDCDKCADEKIVKVIYTIYTILYR